MQQHTDYNSDTNSLYYYDTYTNAYSYAYAYIYVSSINANADTYDSTGIYYN
jgi:hypothetical protein